MFYEPRSDLTPLVCTYAFKETRNLEVNLVEGWDGGSKKLLSFDEKNCVTYQLKDGANRVAVE
jgi:hypothetical protein